MNVERVLSLDISSKTGWTLQVSSDSGISLEAYGRIDKSIEPKGSYPSNYVIWAYGIYSQISDLIDSHAPDVLVIEETSKGSNNAYSQKILEWTHFLVARVITEMKIKYRYFMTEEWRRIVGCNRMSKEDKLRNKEVRDYKKDFEKKHSKKTTVAYDKNGKRIGLVGRKHLNVRKANEIYGAQLDEPLIQADEDKADALLLGYAYHLKRQETGV